MKWEGDTGLLKMTDCQATPEYHRSPHSSSRPPSRSLPSTMLRRFSWSRPSRSPPDETSHAAERNVLEQDDLLDLIFVEVRWREFLAQSRDQ
jgi:hypothetical protein